MLVDEALERLRGAGLDVRVVSAGGAEPTADFLVTMSSPSGERTYAAQVKRDVTRQSAAALHGLSDRPVLVIAPYVSDVVADLFQERGVDYVDAAGNMSVRWGSTLIQVRGRRRQQAVQAPRAPRLFQPRGLQILFLLLREPDLFSAPMRSIAARSDASLGSVKVVVDDLESAGYAYRKGDQRRLVRQSSLFDRWVEAYALTLAPRLGLGRFEAREPRWWRKADRELGKAKVQLGGESAASRLDSQLRTSHAVLYAEEIPENLALAHRWQRSDGKDANVEVRRRFWGYEPQDGLLVPTPLIYADLKASGDERQSEAADRLRESDEVLRRIDGR